MQKPSAAALKRAARFRLMAEGLLDGSLQYIRAGRDHPLTYTDERALWKWAGHLEGMFHGQGHRAMFCLFYAEWVEMNYD